MESIAVSYVVKYEFAGHTYKKIFVAPITLSSVEEVLKDEYETDDINIIGIYKVDEFNLLIEMRKAELGNGDSKGV